MNKKPSIESLREDLRQMYAAAMHHGACWEIGWTTEAAEPRLRSALAELEALRADLAAHDARVRCEALGTGGVEAIAAERKRQIECEGWSQVHDDDHSHGEMADAAASYAWAASHPFGSITEVPTSWPWGAAWWKPKDKRSNLVRAGALIAAEIDRLDRKAILGPDAGKGE